MVAPEDAPAAQHTPDNTGTFGKLKQTLSSSLLTAQDKGNLHTLCRYTKTYRETTQIHTQHIFVLI